MIIPMKELPLSSLQDVMKTRSLLFPVLAGSLVALAQNSVAADNLSASPASNLSVHTSSAAEIVKMRDAGVDGSVIRSYVQTLHEPYKATADDILYLHDHKVPDDVVVEWIKKGGELVASTAQPQSPQSQLQTVQHGAQSPDLVNAATPAPLPVQVQQPAQPAPQQVVYQNPAPTVVYSTPSYVYSDPYWYTSPVSIGFSWGWGYPYYSGGYYHGGHYYGHGGYHGGGYHGGGHYNYVSYRGGGSHGGGSWGGHGGGSWGGGAMHGGGGGGRGGGRH